LGPAVPIFSSAGTTTVRTLGGRRDAPPAGALDHGTSDGAAVIWDDGGSVAAAGAGRRQPTAFGAATPIKKT